jgi:hypothetical protein
MGDEPWVVVPTAGRATLEAAIDSTGVPRERVVIVVTKPNVAVPSWCHAVADFGEVNIHRWWNAGLDFVAEHGGRFACVINDDVLLDERTIPSLVAGLRGATLASPGASALHLSPEGPRTIHGCCWLLDLSHGIRPDEGYRWWYGDDDLDWRARRDGHGVATVPAHVNHLHPNELTDSTPALMSLTYADAQRWAAR